MSSYPFLEWIRGEGELCFHCEGMYSVGCNRGGTVVLQYLAFNSIMSKSIDHDTEADSGCLSISHALRITINSKPMEIE